jgi:hypothetical protein
LHEPEQQTPTPDYVEPFLAWRTWLVSRTDEGFRLRSVIYAKHWRAGQELTAECLGRNKRYMHKPWRRKPRHAAPERYCDCGIYGAARAERAAIYLEDEFTPWRAWNRVIGLVALWGHVVECDQGWRSSCAYPAHIYIPSYGPGRRSDAWEVRRDLGDYGVPVEQVDCTRRAELVAVLARAQQAKPLRRIA